MPIDFTGDHTFPRRGRLPMAHFLWLARVFDKARAHARETIGEYVYPCPIDRGVMARWGVTPAEFENLDRQDREEGAFAN